MTKKIKAIACLVIAVIVVASCAALGVVNGNKIDYVSGVAMQENTASTIKVKWKKVKGAEGYRIYLKNGKTSEYEVYQEVSADKTEFEFTRQKGASVYDMKITAFKHFHDKVIESKDAKSVIIYTLPEKAVQSSLSAQEGELDIKWTVQENAEGYELEYSKNEDFSDSQKEVVDASAKGEYKISDLKPKDEYFVRVRSFAELDGEKVYGEWSDSAKIAIKEKPQMGGEIDPSKPMVALSFDDGPGFNGEKGNPTMEILDVLEKHGARATFFMVGSRIGNSNIECLKREIALGCEIGNHTYDHERYGGKVKASDIRKCSDYIKEKIGHAPTIFRCTGGMMSSEIREECKKEGLPIAYWSVDTEDWKSKNPDAIFKKVADNVYDGSIILMHDIYPTTAQAVKKIVPYLIEKGYQVVGVTEMLTAKNGGKAPKAGEQYVDYKTINNNT